MANVLVEESTLQAIADSIRAKNGSTDRYKPNEMPIAIEEIQAGGGDTLKQLIEGTITEISDDSVESVGDYAFACLPIQNVNLMNAKKIGKQSFSCCVDSSVYTDKAQLTNVSFPNVTFVDTRAFYYQDKMTNIDLPKVATISNYAFQKSGLINVYFPNLINLESYAFMYCKNLKNVDLPKITRISSDTFNSCVLLTSVILRSTTIVTLQGKSAFTSTPIASGTGYIYVPKALVDSYKSATNWSTYANQFRALEDYTVDGTITGELDETKI